MKNLIAALLVVFATVTFSQNAFADASGVEVSKTCLPITGDISGVMTMNCNIAITTHNLIATGNFKLYDFFSSSSQSTSAVVQGTMASATNISSNENWNCTYDAVYSGFPIAGTGGHVSVCELPYVELIAAGTSNINMTFQFTVWNNPPSVINCPYIFQGSSRIAGSSLPDFAPTKSDAIPTNCVELPLPGYVDDGVVGVLDTNAVSIEKTCAEPVSSIYSSVWNCQISVAFPTTGAFAGALTISDLLTLQSGTPTSIFLLSSQLNSNCDTNTMTCVFSGSSFVYSGVEIISVNIYLPPSDTAEFLENCVTGSYDPADGSAPITINGNCVTAVIPTTITPELENTNINKTCEPLVPGEHQGIQGQFWNCQITVNATPAPFAGTLTIIDTPSTNGQVTSMSPATRGNFICTGVAPICTIEGDVFNTTGPELINVQVFAPNDGTNTLQNCVNGIYTASEGADGVSTVGNCVNSDWQSSYSVTKACNEAVLTDNGLVALQCDITVTGLNLPTGTISFTDMFATMPSTTGTLQNAMADITSVDNWVCNDLPVSNGVNTTQCSLPSQDLFDSNGVYGSSTISMNLLIDPQGNGSAINCAFEGNINLGGDGSKSAQQSNPFTQKSSFLPAGCVVIDLPVVNTPPPPPSETSIVKTCSAIETGTHQGVNGHLWDCQIAVTATPAPFTGIITVTDTPSVNTGNTNGQLISMAPATGGNFVCTGTQSCEINGTAFSTTGTELIDVQVFVETTNTDGPFTAQNCVGANYRSDVDKDPTAIDGNCVSTQWTPNLNVSKTCEPIAPVTAPDPYTLNCAITVTGSNLPAGSTVSVLDGFGAYPTGSATIQGPMTNITSNEPWTCIDANANIGLCELPGAELMAAGGSSTINMTFSFAASNDAVSVVNCPFVDITDESYIDQQNKPKGAMQNPLNSQNKSVAGLPDGCVIIDLPTDEPPHITLKKSCDAPVAGF
ncbi:MAG: hypothetical protein OCD03_06300, partial [Hyphomicrobiales bacterium]